MHRIGRTGRAGKKGQLCVVVTSLRMGNSEGLAICFFCPESKGAQDEKAVGGNGREREGTG